MNLAKALFVTGTGTDIGKTYISALLLKKINEAKNSVGYYKPALSGAESIKESDAGYVKKVAGLTQPDDTLLSYLYSKAVSPHLASKMEGNPVEMDVIKKDFGNVAKAYNYVLVEGCGGIVCPIRFDDTRIMLTDIVQQLCLPAIVVADANLGTINATVLTISHLQEKNIAVKGVVLNNYNADYLQRDNLQMIEELTKVPVLATVSQGATDINMSVDNIKQLFSEVG